MFFSILRTAVLVSLVLIVGQVRMGERRVGEHFVDFIQEGLSRAQGEVRGWVVHAGFGELPVLRRWLVPKPPPEKTSKSTLVDSSKQEPEEAFSSSDRESVLRLLE